jgi:hypothetical protein
MRRALLLPLLIVGAAGCVSDDSRYYDSRPRSGYYSGSPYGGGYYPQSRYADNQCTFQTRRGPVLGYRPPGKDRCCVQTREGPSCQ